jgi:polysaccharide biosynthesis transport protein
MGRYPGYPAGYSAGYLGQQEDDLMGYWRTLRKRQWAIILLTVLSALVGVAIANSQPTIFASTATVLVEGRGSGGAAFRPEEGAPISAFPEDLTTQINVMRSRQVVAQTIRQMRLWEQPEFDPRKPQTNWFTTVKSFLGIDPPEPKEWNDDILTEALIGRFLGSVDVQAVAGSRLLRVSFRTQDPDLAPKVVNTWVQVYVEEDRESRFELTKNMNLWLQERSQELQKNVRESEAALQRFREQNQLVSIRGATQAMATSQVEQLTPRVVEAQVKLTQLETAFKQVQSVKDNDFSTVPWVMGYGSVPDARARVTTAQFRVAELSQNYGPEHPLMVKARAELSETQANLRRQTAVAVASLNREYETARATLVALEKALDTERRRAQVVNKAEFELGQLQQAVTANRELYDVFMTRAKQVDIVADVQKAVARMVDPAVPVYMPVAPQKPKIILAALLLGLFGSVAIALLLDFLDNTVKGADDSEKRLGLPTLTSLPILAGEAEDDVLVEFAKEPNSLFAEGIRSARTSLLFAALDEEQRVFVVTSSQASEGKTTLAANLGLALAQNKRTLLIEADMRKPRLAKGFSLQEGARGLSNLVSGTATIDECLHAVEETSLVVMPTGDMPPNPLELLSSARFESAISQLKQQFDFIVIDTPPVELVSDALAVARVASATLFVVKAGETNLGVIRTALKRLERAGARPLGVLLNEVDFAKAQRYYGEYTGFGKVGYKGYYKSYRYEPEPPGSGQ